MTDWTSAAAIVAAGVIAGIIFIVFFKRKPARSQGDDLELRDLEAKRDALIGQIRDLDTAGGDERTRLELATAQILRQLDEHKRRSSRTSAKPEAGGDALKRATFAGFAWGVASTLVLGGLGYFVMQSAKPREGSQGLTGGNATSSIRAAQAPADPALQQLEAAVKKSPDDLNLRNELAHAYLERENLMGVFEHTQYVLSKSPKDARADVSGLRADGDGAGRRRGEHARGRDEERSDAARRVGRSRVGGDPRRQAEAGPGGDCGGGEEASGGAAAAAPGLRADAAAGQRTPAARRIRGA